MAIRTQPSNLATTYKKLQKERTMIAALLIWGAIFVIITLICGFSQRWMW